MTGLRNMKPILYVDFYQTLSDYNFDIDDNFGQYIFSRPEPVKGWMRNDPPTEELFITIGKSLRKDHKEPLRKILESVPYTTINKKSLDYIRQVRERYHTVLITDNMDVFSDIVINSISLGDYFDLIINSADVGRLKNENDGQSFRDAAQTLDSDIKQSILVDDSESSRKTFEALGGNAPVTENVHDAESILKEIVRG